MFNFRVLPSFEKIYKKLQKRYKSIEKDLKRLILELSINPKLGILLKNNIYKIRLKNTDNNKGKSSGYRVIYYYKEKSDIIFVYMYSKNDLENIDEEFVDSIIKELSDFT